MHHSLRPTRRLLGVLLALCLAGIPCPFAAAESLPTAAPAPLEEPQPATPGAPFLLRGIDLAGATRESVRAREGVPDEESDTHLLYLQQRFARRGFRLLYMFDAESGALTGAYYLHIATARKLSSELQRYEALTAALTLAYGEPSFFGDIWTPPEARGEPGDLAALLAGRMRYETRWALPTDPPVGVTMSLSCEEGGLLVIVGYSVVEPETPDA